MRIAVPRERRAGERRVALVPDGARRLIGKGFAVAVEAGAGVSAMAPDEIYVTAGAAVVPAADTLVGEADVVVRIHPPAPAEIAWMRAGTILVALLDSRANPDLLAALAAQ